MAPLKRELALWESIGYTQNLASCLCLKGSAITACAVREAWHAAQQDIPYLRMGLHIEGQGVWFRELDAPTVQLEVRDNLVEDCETHLQVFANQLRDWAASVAYLQLLSNPFTAERQLFLSLNCAGADATSLFVILHTLLQHLAAVTAGKALQPAPQPFIQMHARMPPAIKQQCSGTPPQQPPHGSYMPGLAPAAVPAAGMQPNVALHCSSLDAATTQKLQHRCRQTGVSLQAAVSAASMLAMARVQSRTYQLPQLLLVQAAADMRSEVDPPAAADECAAGSSYHWWRQRLGPSMALLDVAKAAEQQLLEERRRRGGLVFWHRVQAEFFSPPYSVNAAFLDAARVQQAYGSVAVEQLKVMQATHGLCNVEDAVTNVLAYVFAGRLQVHCMASRPGIEQEVLAEMAAMQIAVLRALATTQDSLTVKTMLVMSLDAQDCANGLLDDDSMPLIEL